MRGWEGWKEERKEGRKQSKTFLHLRLSFRKYFSEFVSDLIFKILHFWMVFLAQPLKSTHNENHMTSILMVSNKCSLIKIQIICRVDPGSLDELRPYISLYAPGAVSLDGCLDRQARCSAFSCLLCLLKFGTRGNSSFRTYFEMCL